MSRDSASLSAKYISHLKSLEMTRAKMERLYSQDIIVRRDIEQVYAGLYLEALTSLERVIESLFLGLLVGRITSSTQNIVPRVTFKSDQVAREVVLGGRKYVDWLPYHHTKQRAKAFFRNGFPFTAMGNQEEKALERLVVLRNAIAHKSHHAEKQFMLQFVTPILTPREQTPAGYLRSVFSSAPAQTRYEQLVLDMAIIARKASC